MVLLRLLANILIYSALVLLVYWGLVQDIMALWLAIGFTVISVILFVVTADVRRSRQRDNLKIFDAWDLWYLTDLLEIPFQLLGWLFKNIWRMFD